MDFEDILQDVGGFGRYQKTLVLMFMIPVFTVIPWFFMNMIFMSNTPDHWCYVPEVSHSNLSLDIQRQLIRPPHDSFCLRYDIDYSQILNSGNLTPDSSWPTMQCDNGWQYDTSDYDATAVTKWNMVCNDGYYSSLVLSMTFIGNLCGAPFYSFLSDKVGRKPIFLSLAAIVSLTEICSVLSPNFVLFLVLRVINGSAMSTMYGSLYIIFLEVVSPAVRTHMNGLAATCWTIGLCLLPLLAWSTRNWVHLSIVTSSAAATLLFYCTLLPESPRWLISRERYEEAHAIIAKISKANGKTAHEGNQLKQKIEKLSEKIKKEKAAKDKHSPLDLLRYPTLRKRFLLVTCCWFGNSIPYYGLQINVRNLAGSEFLNFFLMSFVEIPSHLSGWFCMERFGRRWCSVLAFLMTSASCLMPVVLSSEYSSVGVAASLCAKASSSIAFMTVYQQCPELMPTTLRGVGVGLSSTVGTGSALMVPYIVYLAEYGTHIPFLIFSMIAFMSAICASFLPETLHKNLPQTVSDAENFEKNFKFFSFQRNKPGSNPESQAGNWAPAILSASDLASSDLKNVADGQSRTDVHFPAQKTSVRAADRDIEFSVHL